ncbi:hypothetical protein AB0I53_40980 [Saccharopolyspora sp. NPDC050389]|uniref:hypothetical protein n=1 Tax=Saccharopolyspora sp. NPDC050389 TaxID=3155516 RepID=UPI0033EC8161
MADLSQTTIWHGASSAWQAAGLWHKPCRVGVFCNQPVGDRVGVNATHRSDEVFFGATATSAVASCYCLRSYLAGELTDLRR